MTVEAIVSILSLAVTILSFVAIGVIRLSKLEEHQKTETGRLEDINKRLNSIEDTQAKTQEILTSMQKELVRLGTITTYQEKAIDKQESALKAL